MYSAWGEYNRQTHRSLWIISNTCFPPLYCFCPNHPEVVLLKWWLIFCCLWTCVGSFNLLAAIWELVFIMNSLLLNFHMDQFSLLCCCCFLLNSFSTFIRSNSATSSNSFSSSSPRPMAPSMSLVMLFSLSQQLCYNWVAILNGGECIGKKKFFDTKLAPFKWLASPACKWMDVMGVNILRTRMCGVYVSYMIRNLPCVTWKSYSQTLAV